MHKTWKWSVTGVVLTYTHEEIITLCQHAGLAGIEGGTERFPLQDHQTLERIAADYGEAGLLIDSFHLPLGQENDIASFYETDRRAAVDGQRHWMECAAILGSRVVIQHPTTNGCDVDLEGVDTYITQLDKSLKSLLETAEELDLTIALENLPPREKQPRFSSRPEHFERMAKEFDHPRIGFCLDTGHALMSGGHEVATAIFDAQSHRMAAFHLADNAGDRDSHLAPGHGRVDYAAVFRKAAEISFDHPMCIETPPFAQGPFSLDAWKEMVCDTQALAEAAVGGS